MARIRNLLLMAAALSTVPGVYAEEEAEAAVAEVQYLEISPGIIANYGAESGKPKLLNADITLQVMDEDMAEQIEKYLIPVRHDLIMLFSNLKSDEASSGEQVEALRARALESVHASLGEWIKDVQVADLLVTKFVTE
jgi:flagellar protein FliL